MSISPIALLTDFGLEDHYVGSLKGVISSIQPKAPIIDICHLVRPQNILEGAFILREVYPYFPKETIFVAVIDPGVGSSRRAICIQTKKGYLVGPDNGLLSLAVEHEKKYVVREISNENYFLKPVSATFHGRDIFAPVAAHLSRQNIFSALGSRISHLVKLSNQTPAINHNEVTGHIIYIDRFGNAITNIKKSFLDKMKTKHILLRIQVRGFALHKINQFFSEGKPKQLIAIWNSSGYLELAEPNGSAEKRYKLRVGDRVEIKYS